LKKKEKYLLNVEVKKEEKFNIISIKMWCGSGNWIYELSHYFLFWFDKK